MNGDEQNYFPAYGGFLNSLRETAGNTRMSPRPLPEYLGKYSMPGGYAPEAPTMGGVARGMLRSTLPVANAALAGYGAGTMAYNAMPRSWQDTIGGTINQALNRFGGGIDDSDYVKTQMQSQTAPVVPNVETYKNTTYPMYRQPTPDELAPVGGAPEAMVRKITPAMKQMRSY